MLRHQVVGLFATILFTCSISFAQQPATGGFNTPNGAFNNPNGGFNNQNGGFNSSNGGFNNPNGGFNKPNGVSNKPNGGSTNQNGVSVLKVAQQLTAQIDQAWNNRDPNRLLSFFDQNTVWISNNGTRTTVAQEAPVFRQTFANMRNVHVSSVVNDAQVQNGYLVIDVSGQRAFDSYDQGRGWFTVRVNTAAKEIWAIKGGQWRLVQNIDSQSNNVARSPFLDPGPAIRENTLSYYQTKASRALNTK